MTCRCLEYIFSSKLSDDSTYGTLRSVIDAEQARVTHAVRSDVIAVCYPPTGDKKKIKKKKTEPKLKSKDEHSAVEDVSEEPSVRSNRSNTGNETTPRKKDHTFGIDHHIKYNKNERLKHWLKEKNKIYRQHIKEEKVKKREEREKMINDKIEKTNESQKRVKKWMHEKNRELRKIHLEEKKIEEKERQQERKWK